MTTDADKVREAIMATVDRVRYDSDEKAHAITWLADRVEELEREAAGLADQLYDSSPEVPLSKEEINRTVEYVTLHRRSPEEATAHLSKQIVDLQAENAKLRAALQAVREAYERQGDDYGSSKFWGRIAHAIVEHVLPLTEGNQ